jgi:hypothetical protein
LRGLGDVQRIFLLLVDVLLLMLLIIIHGSRRASTAVVSRGYTCSSGQELLLRDGLANMLTRRLGLCYGSCTSALDISLVLRLQLEALIC